MFVTVKNISSLYLLEAIQRKETALGRMTTVGHTIRVVGIDAKVAAETDANAATVYLEPTALRAIVGNSHIIESVYGANDGKKGVVYRVNGSALEQQVHKAIYQVYAQVPRRHDRVAIEDDEFFQNDKVRRIDQARKTFRSGTRLFQSQPERKTPLSSLLTPSSTAIRLVVGPPPPSLPFSALASAQQPSGSAQQPSGSSKQPSGSAQQPSGSAPKQSNGQDPFPGSIPVSLMRSDIKQLYDASNYYVWSWKANGVRFLLVAGTFGGHRLILLVNRARQIFLVPLTVPAMLFDGTILDGELVRTRDGGFVFLVYDAIMTCGVSCGEYAYLIRLQNAGLLIRALGVQNGLFEIRVKPVYGPTQIADMLEHVLPFLDHEIDGLIATAVEPPVQPGQTNTILKHKRDTDHTIDFLVSATAHHDTVQLDLLAAKGGGQGCSLWATTHLHSATGVGERLGLGNELHSATELAAAMNGRIFECRYNAETQQWDPELLRADKTAPNKVSTAWKTWQNVCERLSLLHLFPPDSVDDAVRERLRKWETNNRRWPSAKTAAELKMTTAIPRITVRPAAPVPLEIASQFR